MRLLKNRYIALLAAAIACSCVTESAVGPLRSLAARPPVGKPGRDVALGGNTCDISGIACGRQAFDTIGAAANPLQWAVTASTWFNRASDSGWVVVQGQGNLYSGDRENFDYDDSKPLTCSEGRGTTRANSCAAYESFVPYCSLNKYRLWVHTAHAVTTIGGHFYTNSLEQETTCGSSSDEGCDEGGGDDGGGGGVTLRKPSNRPHFECSAGGGGGDYGDNCVDGHLWIEISYDGGDTWYPLWDEDVQWCDLEE
jgi:hypothetical protein